ncbi:MAG: ABC transporter permease [Bdellovibrionales bacterium]|nr:ABC transporter permease [Bdellovibrionales bacterium]
MTFGSYSLKSFFNKPYRFKEFMQQMEFIGNKSIFIVVLTGTFTGMALSFQVYLGFKMVNATSLTGPIVAMGIARELGPVLSGLIVAARAGGAMAANLGSMRVSEQIDALEVMGVDPLEYLVAPRMWASIVSLPLLTGIFDFVAMVGAYFLCIKVLGMDEAIFWDKTSLWLNPNHINEGLIKAAVFGWVFSLICTYRGFKTKGGARGVGDSTNRGVVLSMVMIIILDFFLMNIIDIYYKVTV